ncbi:branched-chain amino acid aminotransferase II [Gonapodya prolifera JEL478]|uniref:Branched-chain-amino-acid aminotransferase n=1 Tax=Gonapodya prolifera (strain JEL478) TaxID=1344416 RepID=A0A139A5J8_GONPJ|nr:branched-chain amino acid aminotransferase II [Gonapodya prolifera JEL478]|eukprot:KXS11918.1 branched-chain amino acid aminotransferase II [Gonapodya prolifera JEL478]
MQATAPGSAPAKADKGLPNIDSRKLTVELTQTPRTMPPLKDLVFGRLFSDHMLQIEWTAGKGWAAPKVMPYQKLKLEPSAVVFHYAIECFEGLKAYKDADGTIRLFRPEMNMKRLHKSAQRISLPAFDREELLECIKKLVRTDERWIPDKKGYSLYIRPTLIGTQESLGVGPSNRALLFVIMSPVGPYYASGFSATSIRATYEYTRAAPGGTGDAKLGVNYAPGIKPQVEAAKEGYQQNLWLYGKDHQVTEVGTSNFFAFWINEDGERELVTPDLDGTILHGVTRDSVLNLARSWNEFKVTERYLTMAELVKAAGEGRLLECFATGTAAIVSPIKTIGYKGEDIPVPLDPADPSSQAGPLARRFFDEIMAIQYGEKEHEWSVVV